MSMQEAIYEQTAETAVLSCLCHAPSDVQREILISIKEDHFYLQSHKIIFRAIMRAIAKGQQADII
ncbi:MAG: replicative DNA helicase, partial [Micrococcales bacterium]|nr:replicative DNA helicase [Micrococcales bacterium]